MVQVVVGLIGLTVVNHFAPQPAAVGIDAIVEVATLFFPVQSQIQAAVVLLTNALVGHGDTDDSRHVGRFHEDVAAVLYEALDVHAQALIEELGVGTQRGFAGQLRSQNKGRHVTLGLTAVAGAVDEVEALAVAAAIRLAPQLVL